MRRLVAALVADDESFPLTEAAVSLAQDEDPGLDIQSTLAEIDTLALRLPLQGVEGEQALARCRLELNKFALAQELQPIRVIGELGQEMPRGRSGKVQRIVSQ